MTSDQYQALLRELAHVAQPADAASLMSHGRIEVGGLAAALEHDPEYDPDLLQVRLRLGKMPEEDRDLFLMALLEATPSASRGGECVFSIRPESDDVVATMSMRLRAPWPPRTSGKNSRCSASTPRASGKPSFVSRRAEAVQKAGKSGRIAHESLLAVAKSERNLNRVDDAKNYTALAQHILENTVQTDVAALKMGDAYKFQELSRTEQQLRSSIRAALDQGETRIAAADEKELRLVQLQLEAWKATREQGPNPSAIEPAMELARINRPRTDPNHKADFSGMGRVADAAQVHLSTNDAQLLAAFGSGGVATPDQLRAALTESTAEGGRLQSHVDTLNLHLLSAAVGLRVERDGEGEGDNYTLVRTTGAAGPDA